MFPAVAFLGTIFIDGAKITQAFVHIVSEMFDINYLFIELFMEYLCCYTKHQDSAITAMLIVMITAHLLV